MNERNSEALEFARLLALPEDDAERIAAERLPRFRAWKRMLADFVVPEDARFTAAERERDERELSTRLSRALRELEAGEAVQSRETPFARTASRPGPIARFVTWWNGPFARPALAVSLTALVVAGGAWWFAGRGPAGGTLRGDRGQSGPPVTLEAPVASGGQVTLRWAVVPGADGYRVMVYGTDLGERARFDDLTTNTLVLRADALPSGLGHGEQVLIEVVALRGGDAFGTSAMRSLRTP